MRQLFGYDRFADARMVDMMNDIYANECSLFQNHFCPSMKLAHKVRINSKCRQKYDAPRTQYDRVMASEYIDEQSKKQLQAILNNSIRLYLSNLLREN